MSTPPIHFAMSVYVKSTPPIQFTSNLMKNQPLPAIINVFCTWNLPVKTCDYVRGCLNFLKFAIVKINTWAPTLSKTHRKVYSLCCECQPLPVILLCKFIQNQPLPFILLSNFTKCHPSLLQSTLFFPNPSGHGAPTKYENNMKIICK